MSFQDSIKRNQRKPCSVPGCSSPRWRVSSCCASHHNAVSTYGHALGKHLPAKLWAGEYAEVSSLIDRNMSQPPVTAALLLLSHWTDRACRNEGQPAARALQRFHDYGVPLATVLKTAMAVWLYSWRNPHGLPDDIRLDRQMAIACMRLVPRDKQKTLRGLPAYRKHDAPSRRELGTEIRQHLAGFFGGIRGALDREFYAKQAAFSALRLPLTTIESTV